MKIEKTTYQLPVIRSEKLGGTPRDHFDQDSHAGGDVVCSAGTCANLPQEIWKDQPQLDPQGRPQMKSIETQLDTAPHSPILRFLGCGAAGGLGTGFVGLIVGILTGHPGLVVALGAGAGVAVAGGLGAASALGDKTRVEWENHDISRFNYQGYSEAVEPGNFRGEAGYFHRFTAKLETEVIGTYKTPSVIHYRDSAKEAK